mmetsp:Transcript_57718/g.130782  ORF Transcript_57718/g.130782 Transcript_57718/m.130782 type:complete len:222 (+) Transcript_57718:221-886(+)
MSHRFFVSCRPCRCFVHHGFVRHPFMRHLFISRRLMLRLMCHRSLRRRFVDHAFTCHSLVCSFFVHRCFFVRRRFMNCHFTMRRRFQLPRFEWHRVFISRRFVHSIRVSIIIASTSEAKGDSGVTARARYTWSYCEQCGQLAHALNSQVVSSYRTTILPTIPTSVIAVSGHIAAGNQRVLGLICLVRVPFFGCGRCSRCLFLLSQVAKFLSVNLIEWMAVS